MRKEGTDEEELEEEDAFSLDDLVKMLTFHVSAELNVGEIGLELWHDKTTKSVPDDSKPGKITDEKDLKGQSIIAVAAREQRKRDDKKEPTDGPEPEPNSQQSQQPQQFQQMQPFLQAQQRQGPHPVADAPLSPSGFGADGGAAPAL